MTSKPTICVKCKYIRHSIPESVCAAGAQEKMNYVIGLPYFVDAEICSRKNHNGDCPDFEAKEQRPPPPSAPRGPEPLSIREWGLPPKKSIPSSIPESPSPSSPCPPTRLSAEGYVGPACPICRSDMKRRWWVFGRLLGCINEDCRNYWKRKEMAINVE